jgi:hypothetical protein
MKQKKIVRCNKQDNLSCFLGRVLHNHSCFHFGPHAVHQSCHAANCWKLGIGIHGCKCVKVKENENC